MEERNYLLIVLGMSLMSYLPRVVPALFISKVKLSPFMLRFLDLIPYCALSALVFPGIFYSVPGHMQAAAGGTAAALLSAIFKLPLALTVVISVATVLLMLYTGF
ncbi:MAG: AzlD domain-containing protein [Proteobacteria bacterium]|uniref:AzlD domain-containing protein n=1 Tax=Candidatus Avisuccinivibrio stercorigallinarum TaxID=2840704 RepID=A0A9D9GTL9_9GAMM|nr:AzlD domain-containing protein [Candidatus Avisuccinivibrio stercorigallinarum]